MKYDYLYKITFALNEPLDINRINNVCRQYPNSPILVEIQNTKGITSSMIRQLNPNVAIRIAGSYDKDRLERYKGCSFKTESLEDYYYNSVIYTRNETIKILEQMEKIESGINKNWSDIQKIIYIYDRLKTGIMYDPKYEQKASSEIRSLRGLITRQTVCAGYAVIFKEFMDRHNIECEYARGGVKSQETSGHAWNIVTIDGKKYPIDLTWDNTTFRSGKYNSFDWLCQDVKKFSRCHHPAPGEKTQDYEHTLSQLDPQLIKMLLSQTGANRSRNYKNTTYYGKRKDGTKFIVAQIGNNTFDGTNYYRYYYVNITKDGKRELPLILYSETNVTDLINRQRFNEHIPLNFENTLVNILFSPENIADSLAQRTYYIGKASKNTINEDLNENLDLVTSVKEIDKPQEKQKMFIYPTRRYKRSDGSVFIAQRMLNKPYKICGVDVMHYDIFELVKEGSNEVLKRNTIYTERNFFNDNRQDMVDEYLSRERLDRKVGESGGYIGYYDANGYRVVDPDLIDYFSTNKRVELEVLENKKNRINIPTFAELKDLASKYEIYVDSDDPLETDTSKYKIADIKTGHIVTDKKLFAKALFANLWLSSAGIKYYYSDQRPGMNYAFNKSAETLYNIICQELIKECRDKGVIDTVGLFRNIDDLHHYSYNQDILVSLFRTPYQVQFINQLFLQSLGITKQKSLPEPLYSMGYAGKLAFGTPNQDSPKLGH